MVRLLSMLKLGIGCSAALVSCVAPAQALIEIERAVWTDAVDRKTRQHHRIYHSPISPRSAYLWMLVKGSPELLQQLHGPLGGSLPIRHEWYRYESDQVSTVHDVTVDLHIGREENLKKLGYEVDARGSFYWRVWSMKERLSPGWWAVHIVYDSGEPVLCSGKGGQQPCKFMIEVR